ncbi:MAG: hypothetical protein ACOCP4_00685 [Candidatus Woesearchaeota archaeon]
MNIIKSNVDLPVNNIIDHIMNSVKEEHKDIKDSMIEVESFENGKMVLKFHIDENNKKIVHIPSDVTNFSLKSLNRG